MSGKLLEQIRGADQSVELAARDGPEKPAQGNYPLPHGNVGHLAESEPAAFFEDLSTFRYSHRFGNPVMILATADHNGLPGIDVLKLSSMSSIPRRCAGRPRNKPCRCSGPSAPSCRPASMT